MKRVYLILVIAFFTYKTANSLMLDNSVFKGKVARVVDNVVWIKTSQGKVIKEGQVLYVHDRTTDATKAILKVATIKTRYILATIIDDADYSSISKDDKVNNVYKWDSYKYSVQLSYEKDGKTLVAIDDLIIDNELVGISLFDKKITVPGSLIDKMNVKVLDGSLKVVGLFLNDGESISVKDVFIYNLKKLFDKDIVFNKRSNKVVRRTKRAVSDSSNIIFTASDMTSIQVIKRLEGARIVYKYKKDFPYKRKNGNYEVSFRLPNILLGIRSIERKILDTSDTNVLRTLARSIRSYSKDMISWVGVAGSFNGFDESKGIMTKNKEGVYERSELLSSASYEYYFVIGLKGEGGDILLGVIDPYSNKVKNILDIDFDFVGKSSKDDAEDIDFPDISKDKVGDFDFVFGYGGKLSIIDVPGVSLVGEGISSMVVVSKKTKQALETKKDNKKSATNKQVILPYDDAELKLEEARIKERYESSNVIVIDGIRYYSVTFRFNQLNLLPLDIKKKINKEVVSNSPSLERIKKLEKFLSIYNEDRIADISVIVGNFANSSMRKGRDGVWEASVYLPAGRHKYHFAITSMDYADTYYINDVFAEVQEENAEGVFSVVNLE